MTNERIILGGKEPPHIPGARRGLKMLQYTADGVRNLGERFGDLKDDIRTGLTNVANSTFTGLKTHYDNFSRKKEPQTFKASSKKMQRVDSVKKQDKPIIAQGELHNNLFIDVGGTIYSHITDRREIESLLQSPNNKSIIIIKQGYDYGCSKNSVCKQIKKTNEGVNEVIPFISLDKNTKGDRYVRAKIGDKKIVDIHNTPEISAIRTSPVLVRKVVDNTTYYFLIDIDELISEDVYVSDTNSSGGKRKSRRNKKSGSKKSRKYFSKNKY